MQQNAPQNFRHAIKSRTKIKNPRRNVADQVHTGMNQPAAQPPTTHHSSPEFLCAELLCLPLGVALGLALTLALTMLAASHKCESERGRKQAAVLMSRLATQTLQTVF